MRRYRMLKGVLLILLLLLITATKVNAHPHVWIDLRIKPVMNEQSALLGLEQAWRFDPFYSLVLIEELEKGGDATELEERYDQLAWEIVKNLNSVNFFTQGYFLQAASQWGQVTEATLLRRGQRLELRFYLPLAQPLLLKDSSFNYQIYDPTYYIEMLHATEAGLDKTGLTAGCKLELKAPTPSSSLIEQALALDKTETSEDPELGKHFAEQVTLGCLE